MSGSERDAEKKLREVAASNLRNAADASRKAQLDMMDAIHEKLLRVQAAGLPRSHSDTTVGSQAKQRDASASPDVRRVNSERQLETLGPRLAESPEPSVGRSYSADAALSTSALPIDPGFSSRKQSQSSKQASGGSATLDSHSFFLSLYSSP